MYDLVIIGAGVAGLSASIYAKRACLNFVILQDMYSVGSQICNTYEVSNYPGINNVTGPQLYDKILSHANELGVSLVKEKVIQISDADNVIKKVHTKNSVYETKTIVLATGATPKKANILNEDKFVGNGVSYCATCDGAFYKDKTVCVIGGGDVAVEDAIFLSRIVKKVYLIIRKNYMSATKILQETIKNTKNVEILYETVVDSIIGSDSVEGVNIKSVNSSITSELSLNGIFVGIGSRPDIDIAKEYVSIKDGYIEAGETCETSVSGIYAIGDIRTKSLRQVVTACADGANVITSVQKFLNEH